jgi:hypothetical protein
LYNWLFLKGFDPQKRKGRQTAARASFLLFPYSNAISLFVQLSDYETDPYFLQLSQNMATNCFAPFSPEFTFIAPKIVLF